jgi:hypothetical protein
METKQVEELVLQSLEHEKGGVAVYTTAVSCAVNEALKGEWQRYLEQTRTHVTALQKVCKALGIDESRETIGRAVVRDLGKALVAAMQKAQGAGEPAAAQLVACECVVIAETKDHLDWELLGKVAEHLDADGDVLMAAHDKIEEEEDEHLYHTRGWCRELWIQSLGLQALLPPPEELKQVKTAIGAALAEQAGERLRHHH